MYQLRFNNYLLYDPRDEDLIVRSPSVHLAVGEAGSMTFEIDSDHPNVSQLTKMHGVLELLADGSPIYRGRITKDTKDFDLTRSIESEGLLACLNDSIIEPFSFPSDVEEDADYQTAATSGNVVAYYLGWILGLHNAQVGTEQQIQLGTVTVTDANNYVARSSTGYATAWETIRKTLTETNLGGHLLVRYETDGTYLDYYADLPLTNTQTVAFGENLLDLSNEVDATKIYTAILPTGADGLTIADLPDGAITDDLVKSGKTIYSRAGVETYGRITTVQAWTDVTEATNLLTKAAALLGGSGVTMTSTLSVNACDLHFDDATIASFRVGRYTLLYSTPHGHNDTLPLMQLDLDILDPGNTGITLGATIQTQTDINRANKDAAEVQADRQQQEINKQAVDISDVASSVSTQITSVIQTCTGIIMEALDDYVETGDFEAYQETMTSQLAVLSDGVQINISKLQKQITDVDGDLQAKINSITKYFRFTDDGLFIGEEGNAVLLRLDNDVIQFLRDNVPALYLDEHGVNADEIYANKVHVGSYAWINEPDGKISLKKVT